MDMYVKQLLSEIGQKAKSLQDRLANLGEMSKKVFSEVTGHAAQYEKYYQLVKTSEDEKVSPGHLPFSVYSRPETPKKADGGDDEDSERISKILDDRKKVFERNLQTIKSSALLIEQDVDSYVEMMKDLHDYYEDLIEGLKF
jgi:hypothetical protein